MFKFQPKYLIITVLLFLVELFIAVYVHDSFIRPYFGDFLVVVLIYCFCKSFLNVPVIPLAVGVLLFSYTIEILQYFQIVKILGLEDNKIARIVIGSSFGWSDILAYTLGVLMVVLLEKQ